MNWTSVGFDLLAGENEQLKDIIQKFVNIFWQLLSNYQMKKIIQSIKHTINTEKSDLN